MIDITLLFCKIDDFMQIFMREYKKRLIPEDNARLKNSSMSLSEIMTILIYFHVSRYRDFKTYYTHYVPIVLKSEFPKILSYNRFVELERAVTVPMICFLRSIAGEETGLYFVDSTSLAVCHNLREKSNRVFKNIAAKGKTSTGWFYGFKLHLICNDRGEIVRFALTKGNIDDRVPVPCLSEELKGILVGDRGYIKAELFKELYERSLRLLTRIKSNMKNKLMPIIDKLLLRKRAIIETINDQLKNISQIEHTRHRSPINFLVNLFSGLVAYQLSPKKPSIYMNSLKPITI